MGLGALYSPASRQLCGALCCGCGCGCVSRAFSCAGVSCVGALLAARGGGGGDAFVFVFAFASLDGGGGASIAAAAAASAVPAIASNGRATLRYTADLDLLAHTTGTAAEGPHRISGLQVWRLFSGIGRNPLGQP